MILVGVDGGNTKTVAVVSSSDGTLIGAGRAGCGDVYGARSPSAALDAIETAVRAALDECGSPLKAIGAAAFSLAGADWPEDFALYRSELCRRLGLAAPVIVNDAIGALRAGSSNGTGVSVVCGTGAAVGGRSQSGRLWHASFWLGPSGGEEIGWEAMRVTWRSALGIDPVTPLATRIVELFGERDAEGLLHRFTRREGRPQFGEAARAARVVLDEADAGDETAGRIVARHGALLGDYALVAAREVGFSDVPFQLVLAGGLFKHPSRLLANAIIKRVQTVAQQVQAVHAELPPAVGALLMAFEAAEVPIRGAVRERMKTTLPPAAIFAT